jgi:hypothetical protein
MSHKLILGKTAKDIKQNNTTLEQLEIIFSFTFYPSLYLEEVNVFTRTALIKVELEEFDESYYHLDLNRIGLLLMLLEEKFTSYNANHHFDVISTISLCDHRTELDVSEIPF